ncbi:MAG: hypothetical protein AMJ90_01010 [candidate division Zixibacteria bacterium SM23_73_2]|nr:MAG: hypothetical protein AMJ90_01010 [candidate division Zixibacteria bacterium SM23_73_2]
MFLAFFSLFGLGSLDLESSDTKLFSVTFWALNITKTSIRLLNGQQLNKNKTHKNDAQTTLYLIIGIFAQARRLIFVNLLIYISIKLQKRLFFLFLDFKKKIIPGT